MVAALKRLWRADLFSLFAFNLIVLIASLYLIFIRDARPYVGLAASIGNIVILVVVLIIRLRVMSAVVHIVEDTVTLRKSVARLVEDGEHDHVHWTDEESEGLESIQNHHHQ
jgi:predicted membrane protein